MLLLIILMAVKSSWRCFLNYTMVAHTLVFFPSSCHLWFLGEGVSVGEGGGGECGEPYPSACQSCSDDGLVVVQPARRVFEPQ